MTLMGWIDPTRVGDLVRRGNLTGRSNGFLVGAFVGSLVGCGSVGFFVGFFVGLLVSSFPPPPPPPEGGSAPIWTVPSANKQRTRMNRNIDVQVYLVSYKRICGHLDSINPWPSNVSCFDVIKIKIL